jgi:hypothetical protein
MKELVFRKDSWHYRIASFGGFDRMSNQDICTYTRRFLFGICLGALVFAIFLFLSKTIIDVVLGLAFSLIYSAWIMTSLGTAGVIIIVTIGILFLMGLGINYLRDLKDAARNKNSDKPDGFVKHAYKSWKDKYCLKVKIEESIDES